MEREVRYCTTEDGVTIAYAISGHGDRCFVHTCNVASAMIQYDVIPGRREWIEALGERFKVVEYDSRGTGLSQRECEEFSAEDPVQDLAAVMESIGAESSVVFGYLGGAYAASRYAVNQPRRVSHLLLWPPPIIDWRAAGRAPMGQLAISDWETFTEMYAHTALGWARGEQSHAFATVMRETVTRETWLRYMAFWTARPQEENWAHARNIGVPTLVFQRESYPSFAYIAGPIPGATIRMVPGESHGPYVDHVDAVLEAIFDFTGATTSLERTQIPTRVTATILFTDMVDHTLMMRRLGDDAGRAVLREHERITRDVLSRYGGVEVKTDGDSFMATFNSATAAIACSVDLQRAFAARNVGSNEPIVIRAGLNVGEPIEESGDYFGAAVILAARIKDQAGAGEILVPEAVRHLLSGKNFTYTDRGDVTLKGFEDPVHLYEVRWRD